MYFGGYEYLGAQPYGFLDTTSATDLVKSSHITPSSTVMTAMLISDSHYASSSAKATMAVITDSIQIISDNTLTSPASQDTVTPSDVAYYETALTITKSPSTMYTNTFYLTCSISGSTVFTYSVTYDDLTAGPPWIAIDEVTETITYTTPADLVDTTYNLGIYATATSGETSFKAIYLTVSPGVTYSNIVQTTLDTAQTTSNVAIGSAAASSGATSAIAGSSPQGIWSMLNQFQFFLLLPLIGAFVPDAVIDFFQGFEFVTFNFDFMSLDSIPYYKDFKSYFNCDNDSSYLSNIGVQSSCAIVNHIKLFFIIC